MESTATWTRIVGGFCRIAALSTLITSSLAAMAPADDTRPLPGGALEIVGAKPGTPTACALTRTDVDVDIAGFVSRVRVTQHFQNPLDAKIEAVYVFPLPQDAAVDSMTMMVGNRRISGQIKPRDDARRLYEAARAAGHVASLLDQERPNIFTQSVANIDPGAQVTIEISYVDVLRYEDGLFELVFPMVVGPRYMPGVPISQAGTGWAPDTQSVPDGSRISPPVEIPGKRSGHEIALSVTIDAGTEVFDVASELHEIDATVLGPGRVRIALRKLTEIPNRDFILRYRTATDQIDDVFLTHSDERGRFFTLILQPPRRVLAAQAVPKEMIFVIDRSGSMEGFPIEKAKVTMRRAIEQMNPRDTFNLLSFAGGTGKCFDAPVPNTPQNRAVALQYLADLQGSGGTEMMPAIREALGGAPTPGHIRVVAFMTDGYIGNDLDIIDAVHTHAGSARVFAFGIGNSVNRFLLDGMAHAGRGEVEYVTSSSRADAAAARFHERIHSPVLTDIIVDWGSVPVADVYPQHVPDLFSSKPIMIHGRLTAPVHGSIVVTGQTAAGAFERRIELEPATAAATHEGIAALWARAAVADLMLHDYAALQSGTFPAAVRKEIESLGVTFHLVTQFTSFVAIEELSVTVGGKATTVAVPVEMPHGVRYEGVFGAAPAAGGALGRRAAGASQAYLVAPGPSAVAAGPSVRGTRTGGRTMQFSDDAAEARPQVVATPESKLTDPLPHLMVRVMDAGTNGNSSFGTLRVVNYRVDVMIYVTAISPATRAALQALGFTATTESTLTPVLIGTIDLRRLLAAAQLADVLRITTVS